MNVKNIIENITILIMLALMTFGLQSCEPQETDEVEVCFTTTLPTGNRTKSFGDAEQVNTLVVGVYNEQKQHLFTENFVIDNHSSLNIELTLVKDQIYNFIFWAYHKNNTNNEIYDISSLTAIKMNAIPESVTFSMVETMDAFFATRQDVEINGASNYSVQLTRPLAQINVGTTGDVQQASFTAKSAFDIFYPFENTVGKNAEGGTDFIWNFSETTAEILSVEDTEYTYLAMVYLFAPSEPAQINAELKLTNTETPFVFDKVSIQANRRSNILGNFTGSN